MYKIGDTVKTKDFTKSKVRGFVYSINFVDSDSSKYVCISLRQPIDEQGSIYGVFNFYDCYIVKTLLVERKCFIIKKEICTS